MVHLQFYLLTYFSATLAILLSTEVKQNHSVKKCRVNCFKVAT